MNPLLPALGRALLVALLGLQSTLAWGQSGDPSTGRGDRRRSEAPLTTDWFGRPVELRFGYELTLGRRDNFDLDRTRDRDRRTRDQELKAEAQFGLGPDWRGWVEAIALSEVRRRPATGEVDRREGLERGPMWLMRDRLGGLPLAVQFGRVPLVEPRAFWWDDDLDAVRLLWQGERLSVAAGIGRELWRRHTADPGIDPEHKGVTRSFGHARWALAERHAADLFWLRARDGSGTPAPGALAAADTEDRSDARLTWLGLRSSGQFRPANGTRVGYWADLARVSGSDTLTDWAEQDDGSFVAGASATQRVRGRAFDLGLQWIGAGGSRPTLLAAFAHGSGGADGAAIDRGFRQTGLQENKQRLAGVKRFRRYGELFDPELSNLRVATLGFGWRPFDRTSIELAWHRYRQDVASTRSPSSRLSADPNGRSAELGSEIDLLLAVREWQHVEFTLAWSRFMPGAAYDLRDRAQGIEFGLAIDY